MELDVKRLYIDSPIMAKCPKCDCEIKYEYLSYPVINEEFDLDFWCEECDHSFVKVALLHITLELK